ncbi:MAG TPA: crosslink repair DNA glycosylase YcaQ family protein [Mycobacteriales bacterium]|nr:crosslink repair DNA glycosylase YcaQ family protein [Mycobacteriales bacterium]
MVSWADVRARRLERHFLTAPGPSPADVVAAMCGAHAQIATAGELSVGLRLAGAVRDDVRAAVWETRELVRTFGPRGTVHLLPTRDLARWTGALSAVPRPLPSFGPGITLTPDELDAVVAGIGAVLADAALTIDELDAALGDTLGGWAVQRSMPAFQDLWPRWRMAVGTAADRGALCFGPDRDRKITYTSPGVVPTPGAEAWLLQSYLHSYGPARPEHFARWLSAPVPWAAALFAAADLDPVGEWGWVNAGDTDLPAARPGGVRLLPYFDAYGVGSHPRELVFPGRAGERALNRSQAGNFPVLLLGGVVGGVWHQKRSGRHLDVTVEPLDDLSAARRRALDAEVDRVAAFTGLVPRLRVGPVTVGPHA